MMTIFVKQNPEIWRMIKFNTILQLVPKWYLNKMLRDDDDAIRPYDELLLQ